MYFRVELTHRSGVLIPQDRRRREDWLFGRVGLSSHGKEPRTVRALELHPPRANGHVPYAWLYKPEFIAITGRSFTFSGLERARINGQTAWVQQCWHCMYADDAQFEHWVRSLDKVPDWVVLVSGLGSGTSGNGNGAGT